MKNEKNKNTVKLSVQLPHVNFLAIQEVRFATKRSVVTKLNKVQILCIVKTFILSSQMEITWVLPIDHTF